MKKKTIRNIGWITLIAVLSFIAGAYFHLGWVRDRSVNYLEGFILGGIGMWIVFFGMGILIYKLAKKNGNEDPARPSLSILSFFTLCFLLMAWIKYDDVQKDKFLEDFESSFITHYENKASIQGLEIDNLDRELESIYSLIRSDIRKHPQLEELMQLETADALFEENRIVAETCVGMMEIHEEIGYPYPAGMVGLFE